MNGITDKKLQEALAAFEKLLLESAAEKKYGEFSVVAHVVAGRVNRYVVNSIETKK